MTPVTPLPSTGEIFLDRRGGGRALRLSWHPEADLVVLSLWQGATCTGTFRLPVEDVPTMVEALRGMLDAAYDAGRPLDGTGDGPGDGTGDEIADRTAG